ncbi:hypothetical protein C8R45DRAFT_960572 [Mycena sanguinolenta]|nr:hypothetical protein C8R45DRAFT_960572 [Mycena sanguinolenta]
MLSFRALRLMPTRVFHTRVLRDFPIIPRSLATVAGPIAHARTRNKGPCAEFYRTQIDLGPFSCDWDHFVFSEFFTVGREWYDLTKMEFFVKRVMKIGGTIRPLAFLPVQDPCIVFEAGGNYYFLDTCTSYVEDFGGNFASDDGFLAAFTRPPRVTGKKYRFPKTTDELYAEVSKEQKRRAKAAQKSRQGRVAC